MLCADGAELAGELRPAEGVDLVGVDLCLEAQLQPALQDLPAVFDGEDAGLAEDVAVFGKAGSSDRGQHFLADEPDVVLPLSLVFGRHGVRAEEGGDQFHGLRALKVPDDAELL